MNLLVRRGNDGESAIRSLAEQGRELIARQRRQPVDRVGFDFGGLKLRARQAQRAFVLKPGLPALFDKRGTFPAGAHGILRGLLVGKKLDQNGIGPGHGGGNLQTCFGLFCFCRIGVGGCRGQRRAVLAEEVEFVIEAGGDFRRMVPAARQIGLEGRRESVVKGFLRLLHAGHADDRRPQVRAGDVGHGLGGAHACGRDLEIGRAGQGLINQLVELRIAIGFPPGLLRPFGNRSGEALGGFIAARRLDLGLVAQVRRTGAERKKSKGG